MAHLPPYWVHLPLDGNFSGFAKLRIELLEQRVLNQVYLSFAES